MDFANRIVSYNVLAFELARLSEAARQLDELGKLVPIAHTTRAQSLEFRQEMLQLQVESGALSLEAYLQALREAIPREKARSKELKALPGGARRAVDAFKHAQIMVEELAEAVKNQKEEGGLQE